MGCNIYSLFWLNVVTYICLLYIPPSPLSFLQSVVVIRRSTISRFDLSATGVSPTSDIAHYLLLLPHLSISIPESLL